MVFTYSYFIILLNSIIITLLIKGMRNLYLMKKDAILMILINNGRFLLGLNLLMFVIYTFFNDVPSRVVYNQKLYSILATYTLISFIVCILYNSYLSYKYKV